MKKIAVIAIPSKEHEGMYLFGRRKNEKTLSLPGGHMNFGEAPEAGAKRELFEETGLEGSNFKLLSDDQFETENGPIHVFLFTCDIEPSKLSTKNDPDHEFSEYCWADPLSERSDWHVPPARNLLNIHLLNTKKDELPGGKGDSKKDSDFDPKEVRMGHKVESEHTKDPEIAAEITRDHLSEDSKYYNKLKSAGLADELDKEELSKPEPYMAEDNDEGGFRPIKSKDNIIEWENPQDYTSSHRVQKVHSVELPNGLRHDIHEIAPLGNNPAYSFHTLHHKNSKDPLAFLRVEHNQPFEDDPEIIENIVRASSVNPKFKGKGLGKQLYRAAAMHHGDLLSDSTISPHANDVWQGLNEERGFDTSLAPYEYDYPEPHSTRFLGGHDKKKMFPEVNIPISKRPGASKIKSKSKKKKRLAAAEPSLQKGVNQRLFPYSPGSKIGLNQPPVGGTERAAVESWQQEGGPREDIPELTGNARIRALKKLAALTKWRRNPDTGEAEFLLHRGAGPSEDRSAHRTSMTSWTPHYHVAESFESDYQDFDNPEATPERNIFSHWIPESAIHHIPIQVGPRLQGGIVTNHLGERAFKDPTTVRRIGGSGIVHSRALGNPNFRNEFEVVVKPNYGGFSATPEEIMAASAPHLSSNVNDRINDRAGSPTGHKKLAASELLKEELSKGAKRRLFPVNAPKPKRVSSTSQVPPGREVEANWQYNKGGTSAWRDSLQQQTPEERARGFLTLQSRTKFRKNPITGNNEYLLHRGHNINEVFGESHKDRASSWTPSIDVARERTERIDKRSDRKITSAWFPEQDIKHFVYQTPGAFATEPKYHPKSGMRMGDYPHPEFNYEREIVIKPGHSGQLASEEDLIPEKPQKLAASELDKGLMGDWKKEGYQIKHVGSSDPDKGLETHSFQAVDKNGHPVGMANFVSAENHIEPDDVWVSDDHGRKGIATAIYQAAEAHTRKKIKKIPELQSGMSRALWSQPARPFGFNKPKISRSPASKKLGKGLMGDWEKEGYSVKSKRFGHNLKVTAHDKSGKEVGKTHIRVTGEDLQPQRTDVSPKHRRKGLATAMYDHAEQSTGGSMIPGSDQTKAAKALWSKRLGKTESLSKMSRPRITFPGLPKVTTRPDQEVQVAETPRQAKMFGHKAANAHFRNDPRIPDVARQNLRDREAKRISGTLSRIYSGVNVNTPQGPKAVTTAGALRAKFESGGDEYKQKMDEHRKLKNQIIKDYNQKYLAWHKEANEKLKAGGGSAEAYNEAFANKPVKPKLPRAPSKPRNPKLTPEQQVARGKGTDQTIEHEGLHNILDQVERHYGHGASIRAQNKLLNEFDPEVLKSIASYISTRKSYKPKSKSFNEEVLAHARDILVSPESRKHYLNFAGDEGEKNIKKMKQGWQKAYQVSQTMKPEDVQFQTSKLAVSEKAPAVHTDKLYRIHHEGHAITHPMKLSDLTAEHGPVHQLEKDPKTKVMPYTPKLKKSDDERILRFDSPEHLSDYLKNGTFGLVTPHLSENDEAKNKQAHRDFLTDIMQAGHKITPLVGQWGGTKEPSYMVHDISPADLTKLGQKYGQASVIHSNRGSHQDISTRKDYKAMAPGSGHELGDAFPDNYSEIQTAKGPARFRLKF